MSAPSAEHLYASLHSPRGRVLQIYEGTVEQWQQTLYRLRKRLADPDLMNLSLVPSPIDPTQLWIVKRDAPPKEP